MASSKEFLTVLLVDDEPFIRDMLKSIIDWEANGYQVIGDSYNGVEALKILESQRVDILLTDLKMPVMDGLELIRRARSLYPSLRIVVVSAYDEFGMVSEAFKLGAEEYLLKAEMTSGQVTGVLKGIGEKIFEDREKAREAEEQKRLEQDVKLNNQRMKQLFHQNKWAIREQLLKEAIWGEVPVDDRKMQEFQEFDIKIGPGRKKVMLVEIDDYIRLETNLWKDSRELLNFAILNVIEEILGIHQMGDAFRNSPGQYVVILSFDGITSEVTLEEKMVRIYQEIQKGINSCFTVNTAAGISEVGSGFKSLRKLYRQALEAKAYSFVNGKGRLVSYIKLPARSGASQLLLAERLDHLKELLRSKDSERMMKEINALQVIDKDILPQQIDGIKNLFGKYYYLLVDFAEQNHISELLSSLLEEYREYLKDYGTLAELNGWLERVLTQVGSAAGEGSQLINKAKNFIHKHYRDNISLTELAEELGVSPSYLSRTFTRVVGMNFVEYLTNVRIKVAMNYMKNTELKVYEIAEKVGYATPEHFSRAFKKVTGKSPKEYLG